MKRIDPRLEALRALNALQGERTFYTLLKRDFPNKEPLLLKEIHEKQNHLDYLRDRYTHADAEIIRLDTEIANFDLEMRIQRERVIHAGAMTPSEKADAKHSTKIYRIKERIRKAKAALADLEANL